MDMHKTDTCWKTIMNQACHLDLEKTIHIHVRYKSQTLNFLKKMAHRKKSLNLEFRYRQ